MGSYPTFWLTLAITNVVSLMPAFAIKWWLMQCVLLQLQNFEHGFLTLVVRYEPELCDVVRASRAISSSSPSTSGQPVPIQSVGASARPSTPPAQPASVSKQIEMQSSDFHADTLTIPNTPIDKL
jgi:hypothetical protein